MTFEPFTRSLTGSAERPTVILSRHYPAGPAEVWAALTDPVRLARWLGDVETDAGDPARVSIRFADDPGTPVDARVTDCRAPQRLALEWEAGTPHRVTARLEADADRTTLRLDHALGSSARIVDRAQAWEERLADLVLLYGGERAAASPAASAAWRTIAAHPLELAIDLPHAAAAVWPALVTREGLRRWWWNHWDDVEIDVDARPGGTYRFAAARAGIVVEGTYLDVDPASHLSFTWRWVDADGTSADEACDIRIDDTAGGCRLTVRHTGPWADDAPAESYRQGWEFVLGALRTALDTTRPDTTAPDSTAPDTTAPDTGGIR